jgi:glutamate N-acetyltransferase/amino-acid N-acetyltransferase
MAVGKCFDAEVQPTNTDAWINGYPVVRGGERLDFDENRVRAALKEEVVELVVSVGSGSSEATAFGCDFTAGYIEENAAYVSS